MNLYVTHTLVLTEKIFLVQSYCTYQFLKCIQPIIRRLSAEKDSFKLKTSENKVTLPINKIVI